MFNKISQIPLLSLLLVLQFLSNDVSSDIEPFPMSGFPMGSSNVGGGGGVVGMDEELLGSVSASNSGSSGDGTTSNGFFKWSPRQIQTKLGIVQGFIVRPPNGYEGVEVFLNMPYASSPEGSLRFMPPVSGSPWKGIRRSETPSPVCPQVLPNIRNETEALKMMPRGKLTHLRRLLPHLRNQSEDCLYLNLRVPLAVAEGRAQGKLPVLVFVHGDDYGFGGGHPYDPSMLVSQGNIIVITMNYRLGILGVCTMEYKGSHHSEDEVYEDEEHKKLDGDGEDGDVSEEMDESCGTSDDEEMEDEEETNGEETNEEEEAEPISLERVKVLQKVVQEECIVLSSLQQILSSKELSKVLECIVHNHLKCYICFTEIKGGGLGTSRLCKHYVARHCQGEQCTLICPYCNDQIPLNFVTFHMIESHITLSRKISFGRDGNF